MSNDYRDPQTLERLVRIETKIDYMGDMIKGQDSRINSVESRVPDPDHEARIRKIERAMWIVAGLAAAGGGTAGGFISQILGGS